MKLFDPNDTIDDIVEKTICMLDINHTGFSFLDDNSGMIHHFDKTRASHLLIIPETWKSGTREAINADRPEIAAETVDWILEEMELKFLQTFTIVVPPEFWVAMNRIKTESVDAFLSSISNFKRNLDE